MRFASFDQSGMFFLKQSDSSFRDLLHRDRQQALFRGAAPLVRSQACRAPQHEAARSIRAGACRISGAVNSNYRDLQSGSQMEGARIATNEQPGTAGKRDEVRDRRAEYLSAAVARPLNLFRDLLFSRTMVNNRAQATSAEKLRRLCIPLCGPLLRAPTGAWIHQHKIFDPTL